MIYLTQIVEVSQIFTNIAVGFGAIVGTYFGTNELRARIKTSRLKKRFPSSRVDIDFKIVDTSEAKGKLFIIEDDEMKRFWIQNYSTYADLGFIGLPRSRISAKELEKYSEPDKPVVLTRGQPGT
jgi:hypothetical protein